MSQVVGAGAQVTCGGPRAALGREAGARVAGARGGPGAAPGPEPGGGSQSRGDMWQSQSCPQLGGGSHCLDLMLVRGGGGGADGKVRQRPPLKLKMSMMGPLGVPELEIWDRSTFRACPSGRTVNGCRNLGQMLKE
jgi:hypothetical protein